MTDDDKYPVAVAGLQRKRAEIAGTIADLEKQLIEPRNDLSAIDRALLLMNSPMPGEAIPARKPKPRNITLSASLVRRTIRCSREYLAFGLPLVAPF